MHFEGKKTQSDFSLAMLDDLVHTPTLIHMLTPVIRGLVGKWEDGRSDVLPFPRTLIF